MRSVFDTFLAAHCIDLEESYIKFTHESLDGHFGWLTLLPDARILSYKSLMRRKNRKSVVDRVMSPVKFKRSALDRVNTKSLEFKYIARDDVDDRVILVFQAPTHRGRRRKKSIVCNRFRAPTEMQCESMYTELLEIEGPTRSIPDPPALNPRKSRRRSTIKSTWNPLASNSPFNMFSRIRFSGKRRRRSLFGMKHRQWQEYFYMIRGNPSGYEILKRAMDELDPTTLLQFDFKSGLQRLNYLRQFQFAESSEPYLEWYKIPFEKNFLDELLERVTSQMRFYDHPKGETRSLKTSFVIFRKRSSNTQIDENGHLICDYICETLDEEGFSVRVKIKWYHVMGVVRSVRAISISHVFVRLSNVSLKSQEKNTHSYHKKITQTRELK